MDEESFWLGYCVGLFEGEGSVNVVRNGPDRVYPRLVVRMTDREPVEHIYRLFGGRFMGPYTTPGEAARGYKPKYRWALGTLDAFLATSAAMYPHLSPRRQAQIDRALSDIAPLIARATVAGNRRDGVKLPYRDRKIGELTCPSAPEPSTRGYQRHKRLGIPACEICLASYSLYYVERRKWDKEKIAVVNRGQYAKNREARIAYQRAYYARKRAERQQTSS